MELNLHLNFKPILDGIHELKEEILAIMKEFTTELVARISLSNKIDSQPTADYSIKQTIQEEDFTENKEKRILLDKQLIYGVEDQETTQEEDLTEKKEKLILFNKQLIYGVEDQEKQRQRFEMLLQRNFMAKRNRGLMQRLRWFIWTQMILQAIKRDLLLGREALLWRFTWQKKQPRIRLKK